MSPVCGSETLQPVNSPKPGEGRDLIPQQKRGFTRGRLQDYLLWGWSAALRSGWTNPTAGHLCHSPFWYDSMSRKKNPIFTWPFSPVGTKPFPARREAVSSDYPPCPRVNQPQGGLVTSRVTWPPHLPLQPDPASPLIHQKSSQLSRKLPCSQICSLSSLLR